MLINRSKAIMTGSHHYRSVMPFAVVSTKTDVAGFRVVSRKRLMWPKRESMITFLKQSGAFEKDARVVMRDRSIYTYGFHEIKQNDHIMTKPMNDVVADQPISMMKIMLFFKLQSIPVKFDKSKGSIKFNLML